MSHDTINLSFAVPRVSQFAHEKLNPHRSLAVCLFLPLISVNQVQELYAKTILLTGSPAKFGHVLIYSPCLFGKKLFSMQDKLVNNKQTHLLKQ